MYVVNDIRTSRTSERGKLGDHIDFQVYGTGLADSPRRGSTDSLCLSRSSLPVPRAECCITVLKQKNVSTLTENPMSQSSFTCQNLPAARLFLRYIFGVKSHIVCTHVGAMVVLRVSCIFLCAEKTGRGKKLRLSTLARFSCPCGMRGMSFPFNKPSSIYPELYKTAVKWQNSIYLRVLCPHQAKHSIKRFP